MPQHDALQIARRRRSSLPQLQPSRQPHGARSSLPAPAIHARRNPQPSASREEAARLTAIALTSLPQPDPMEPRKPPPAGIPARTRTRTRVSARSSGRPSSCQLRDRPVGQPQGVAPEPRLPRNSGASPARQGGTPSRGSRSAPGVCGSDRPRELTGRVVRTAGARLATPSTLRAEPKALKADWERVRTGATGAWRLVANIRSGSARARTPERKPQRVWVKGWIADGVSRCLYGRRSEPSPVASALASADATYRDRGQRTTEGVDE